jgi:hypothetical protein
VTLARQTFGAQLEAMKRLAIREPATFAQAMVDRMADSPHYVCALLLSLGHTLPAAAISGINMELGRLDMASEPTVTVERKANA